MLYKNFLRLKDNRYSLAEKVKKNLILMNMNEES